MKIVLFCSTALTLISWDRASKEIAKEHLKDKPGLSYLNNGIRLEYVENTGAAMSLGDELSKTASFWLLSILPLGFLMAIAAYSIRNARQMSWLRLFSIMLIIAGGIGNIIDRILFDRHVSDFMILSFKGLHTGVFNFADVYVTTGVLMLLLGYRKEGKIQALAS